MVIEAKNFGAIGVVQISQSLEDQGIVDLKTWFEKSRALNLFLILDITEASIQPPAMTSLAAVLGEEKKAGLKIIIVKNDPTWNGPRTVLAALGMIGSPEAKRLSQVISVDEKLRQLTAEEAQVEKELVQWLAKFEKKMEDLEKLTADDFVKINNRKMQSPESQLAFSVGCIKQLKTLKGQLANKTQPANGQKVLDEARQRTLSFINQKGLT